MKYILTFIILGFSINSFAVVQNCYRKAQIMGGVVNHHWIKTDTKTAGMGSGNSQEQIGDRFEAPYTTHVFVIDHSDQEALNCKEIKDVDEDCVNAQLDIGKPLGRFNLINNCQTYVSSVLKRCSTKELNHYGNGDLYAY